MTLHAQSFGLGWALRSWTGAPAFEPRAAFVAAGSAGFPERQEMANAGGRRVPAWRCGATQEGWRRWMWGANVLVGADALRMVEKAKRMMGRENGWKNPFGDGRAGESILEHLTAG